MNVKFITFGCKVNQYETACLKELFQKNSFLCTENDSDADIFIINSCTVTASSDSKVFQCIKKLRKKNPDSLIALTGCYPQAFKDEAQKIAEADIVTGTENRMGLLELVKKALSEKSRQFDVCDCSKTAERMMCTTFEEKTRAFMKIQDGCNQFCSYCIIPYARGRIRSKALNDVITEAKALADFGHKEIVLVGINLAFYGKEYGLRLADAVEAIAKIDGIKRIRLGSLEPEEMTDTDLDRLSAVEKLCPHFHLSLQSGCTKTLKRMNRKYTAEEYTDLVNRIRERFPDASFTTDIMVGFPDETQEDFMESVSFMEKTGFSKVHVFPYSQRKGTPAAEYENQIDEKEKTKRAEIMKKHANQISEKIMKSKINHVFPVLFEKEHTPDFHNGHTPDYTLIKIPSKNNEKSLRGMIFYVKIKECDYDCCIGEIIESPNSKVIF